MVPLTVLIVTSAGFLIISISGHCIDIHSQVVSQGLHYVPGPNPCTLCICDKGVPRWCKSVLCSPPQNCKSFQVGNSCCEFKCLDDILTANDGYKESYDLALRLVASAVTAVLSLSLLFFLLHRLKRRKIRLRQNRQISEDQRSMNSIGYIAGSLGYLSGNIGYLGAGNSELEFHYEDSTAHYSLWKPPGNYFPRDEAPPPYEEAVRTAQAEQNALNTQVRPSNGTLPSINTVSHSSQNNQNTPLTTVQCRHEYAANNFSINHEYANVSSVPNIAVYQNCSGGANLRQDDNANCASSSHQQNQRSEKSKSYENVVVKPTCSEIAKRHAQRQNGNVKTQTKEFIRKMDKTKGTEYYKAKDKNYFYENTKHRTIPNLSEYQLKDSGKVKEGIKHKSRVSDRTEASLRNLIALKDMKNTPVHCTLPKNLRELSVVLNTETLSNKPCASKSTDAATTALAKSHANLLDKKDDVIAAASVSLLKDSAKKEETHSFISYQYLSSQDDDDYRSECENCKSSGFTNRDDEETDVLNETMTLQRRPLEQGEEVPYYRTSLTLPTNTKKTRAVVSNPGRESWFVAMQETSSSDESD